MGVNISRFINYWLVVLRSVAAGHRKIVLDNRLQFLLT